MQNTFYKMVGSLRFLLSKINFKIYGISVVIASFIWLMMSLSTDYDENIDIPVVYNSFPSGMILVNKPPVFISVKAKAQGYELLSATLKDLRSVEIDVSKLQLKRTKYNRFVASVSTRNFRFEILDQLKVDDIGKDFKPDSIYFIFDSLVTKNLPVKLCAKFKFNEGFMQYGETQIDPPFISVSGPALTMNKLTFISTDSLFLNDLNTDVERDITLRLDDELLTSNSNLVKVKIQTEKYSEFTRWVPIQVQSNVPNIKIKTFPSKIKLTFNMALSDYKLLNDSSFFIITRLDSLDLLVQKRLILQLDRKPPNIGVVEMSSESVEYLIQD